MATPSGASRRFSWIRPQETGLVLVALVLSVILAVFGGSVKTPKFTVAADGSRERVFVDDGAGNHTPVFEEHNKFLNAQTLVQLAKDTSFVAIMAVGMTFVIIAGQIDLSVGAIYALAGVLGAMVLRTYGPDGPYNGSPGAGSMLGVAACLGAGLVCGLLNGLMITALRVHPFIVTLGTMAIYRGAAFVLTQGQSIGGFPASFRQIVKAETAGGLTPAPLLVMLLVAAAGGIALARSAPGRRVYAVGGNEMASRFSGIPVDAVKLLVFAISGLSAGLSACLSLGYYGAATSGDGQGYELSVIAAAVVGGASLNGGKGTALGALLGALVIQMIASGIVILGIDQNYSQIIVGVVVIGAVLIDQANAWWLRRRAVAGR
jgi:ribose/xylose/arabinose/galactoside ABC-type transport system permease subunit